jgi:transcriptional regulator with XRE-family HTH domain
MFGEIIKNKRLDHEMTLREFCRQLDEDPSNWSKIERGLNPPPKDEKKLKKNM